MNNALKKPMGGTPRKPFVVMLVVLVFIILVWAMSAVLRGAGLTDTSGCDGLGKQQYGETKEKSGEYTIKRDYFYSESLGKCLAEITVSLSGDLVRYAITDISTGGTLIGYDKTCVGNYAGNQYEYAPADGPCITLDAYKAKKAELK
jgi:hypothetical protein